MAGCLLTSEAHNFAVLDSGCTSKVAVKFWIECYWQSLSKHELLKVIHEEKDKVLKFGRAETKSLIAPISSPCILNGKHI